MRARARAAAARRRRGGRRRGCFTLARPTRRSRWSPRSTTPPAGHRGRVDRRARRRSSRAIAPASAARADRSQARLVRHRPATLKVEHGAHRARGAARRERAASSASCASTSDRWVELSDDAARAPAADRRRRRSRQARHRAVARRGAAIARARRARVRRSTPRRLAGARPSGWPRAKRLRPKPPARSRGTLRDYQIEGHAWLARLAAWGAGACLADDMGLGKTVQAIALLLDRAKLGPALVVAPTSRRASTGSTSCAVRADAARRSSTPRRRSRGVLASSARATC